MAKGFIFDVDGTILDSMEIWMDAAKLYLKDLGIEAEENLGDIMFSLTMAEGSETSVVVYIFLKYFPRFNLSKAASIIGRSVDVATTIGMLFF